MPASQPVAASGSTQAQRPDMATGSQPPSDLALCSVGTRTSTTRSGCPALASFLTLPTTLLHLVTSCLIDKEALQLILSCRALRDDIQGFYQSRLRVPHTLSPIASYQNPVHRQPKYVPMDTIAERIFQDCVTLKARGWPDAEYCRNVLQVVETCLSSHADLELIMETSIGVGLSLGGSLMPDAHRDALLDCIQRCCKTGSVQNERVTEMVYGMCVAQGGENIPARKCGEFMDALLDRYASDKQIWLTAWMCGLFTGLGGEAMSRSNLVMVLDRLMVRFDRLHFNDMGGVIAQLCIALGGPDISPPNRDLILARILASHATCSDRHMGTMIWSMCRIPGGGTAVPKFESLEHLHVLISHVVKSHATCSALQMGTMVHSIVDAPGNTKIDPLHRDILVAHLRTSGQLQHIVEGMKLSPVGRRSVAFLQLEK